MPRYDLLPDTVLLRPLPNGSGTPRRLLPFSKKSIQFRSFEVRQAARPWSCSAPVNVYVSWSDCSPPLLWWWPYSGSAGIHGPTALCIQFPTSKTPQAVKTQAGLTNYTNYHEICSGGAHAQPVGKRCRLRTPRNSGASHGLRRKPKRKKN